MYLHAGMNLQDHLESHPKEKVIAALVNLTLFQQQSSDECTEDFDCNQYESSSHLSETTQRAQIPSSIATRTYEQNNHAIASFGGTIRQHSAAQAAHQVMIVDRTRVFHERSNVAIDDESCRRATNSVPLIAAAQPKIRTIPVQALQLITTNGLAINQRIQALRPPPPYCVSVKDSLLKQSGASLQQNEPSHPQKLFAAVVDHHAMNMNAFTGFDTHKHREKSSENIYNTDDKVQVQYEGGYDPDEHGKKQFPHADTEESLATSSVHGAHQENAVHTASSSVTAEKIAEGISGRSFEIEKNAEKRTAGLQVISNVKVIPNTVLNMTSLNAQIGDNISMKDVFIIGAASTSQKLVPTSRASKNMHSYANNNSDANNINGLSNLLEVITKTVKLYKTNKKHGEKLLYSALIDAKTVNGGIEMNRNMRIAYAYAICMLDIFIYY